MKKLISSLLFCCLLVLSLHGICEATATYQLTESQLTQLENNINQLEINNNEQEKQLQQVNQLLQKSNNQITISDQQIMKLNQQLMIAGNSIEQAEKSLKIANEYWEKLEQAEKFKIKKLTFERDIIGIGLLYMIFKK